MPFSLHSGDYGRGLAHVRLSLHGACCMAVEVIVRYDICNCARFAPLCRQRGNRNIA